jgi:hypothetical protein
MSSSAASPFPSFPPAPAPCTPVHLEARPYPDFVQDGPRLGNAFVEDPYLRATLQRILGDEILRQAEPDLTRFGTSVGQQRAGRRVVGADLTWNA